MTRAPASYSLRLAIVMSISLLASLSAYTDTQLSRTAAAINTVGYEDSPLLVA